MHIILAVRILPFGILPVICRYLNVGRNEYHGMSVQHEILSTIYEHYRGVNEISCADLGNKGAIRV